MNSVDDLIALVRDELGLPVTIEDARRGLPDLPGWESGHLLTLVTVLERHTSVPIGVIDLLEAPNLASIYELTKAV